MALKNINWGIVGCGDVAEIKSGPAFQKVQNSSLISVMRRNEEKVKDFAARHHVPNYTTSASELINDKKVNAVYIATPPYSHLNYTKQAIQAGKNVYLEKPMVLNSKEADELLGIVNQSNVKVTVAHYRRNLPLFIKVKELLDANVIGKVSSAEIDIAQSQNANLIAKTDENWRLNPEISGGGYFHDIAPHQIDLMYHYFGEVAKITKGNVLGSVSSNDLVIGEVEFKNGVQFKGSWNFAASEDSDRCTLNGEKGTITFSFYSDEISVDTNNKTETFKFENPKHVQQPMIEEVVGYFLGENENPCSVGEAAVVTKIMDTFCGIE
ncbi:Gfo/Idh/MocA family oxidoreductase [Hyunsoonleella sp. SJ7]|uniref:Gfo/Idh/MocA family oxidoreductase n=1 Tax=Hyunsoonleella aquatilis TaxID=2762758 RepID=A0A923HAC2_9FLAO|nr:Gfo/Idh/MocA family oxidoreductase [Hyunsoonleella aquatilis]MBC3758659.1 Gfo/Idh/MocA family oxidoreductase [Hyunsoonleella aquatilis]